MRAVLTPPRLTSLLPPLENWLVRLYNMVRPRFLASLKWEPLFLLRLLSSEPVSQIGTCQLDQEIWQTWGGNSGILCSVWTLSGLYVEYFFPVVVTQVYFPRHGAWYSRQTVSRFHLKTHRCPNQTSHCKNIVWAWWTNASPNKTAGWKVTVMNKSARRKWKPGARGWSARKSCSK